MKTILSMLILSGFAITSLLAQSTKSIYDYKVTAINGKEFDFASLKGKKVMIVNTASKCGFTPQYKELEELYKTYGSTDFVIIGFPANNFMSQEPGTNQEIQQFCTLNYGVTFPMMAKISVKGNDMASVYLWLTSKNLNGKLDSGVKWNFQKYLINKDGTLEDVFYSATKPNDEKIIKWIKG
jgi:glutathione peroxidase